MRHATAPDSTPSGTIAPAGDLRGLTPESLIPQIREIYILFLFGRINTYTDQMIAIFNSILEGNYIASKMMSTISKSHEPHLVVLVSHQRDEGHSRTYR